MFFSSFRNSRKLRNTSEINSQFKLGLSYVKKGGDKNILKAHSIFLELIKKNHVLSYFELSQLYCHGHGVNRELTKALQYAEKAFELGLDKASNEIGYIYYSLDHYKKAYEYYEIAVDKNIHQAAFNLALMNLYGEGVKTNINKAILLFEKKISLTENNKSAYYQLGLIYYDKKKYDKAKEYLENSDNYGADAAIRLGIIHEYGFCHDKVNFEKAVFWYKKAAEAEDADGQYRLGSMYSRGLGLSQSDKLALVWYKKAAKQGSASGQYHLAVMYDSGEGVERDRPQATKLYKKAMEQDLPDAFYALGLSYFYGRGVSTDKEKTKELMIQASNKGVAKAKTFLKVNFSASNQNTDQSERYIYKEKNMSHSSCRRCGNSANYTTIYQCRNCGCIFCTTCSGSNVLCPGRGCPVCDKGCGGEIAIVDND